MLLKIVMSMEVPHMEHRDRNNYSFLLCVHHRGVCSAEMSISLAGCSGNTYLELIKILHMVKYLNEKGDVEGSACWWLFSYLAAFLVFPTQQMMIFCGGNIRKNTSLYSHIHHQEHFPFLAKKNLKRQKKRKKDVSFQSPIISGYFLI